MALAAFQTADLFDSDGLIAVLFFELLVKTGVIAIGLDLHLGLSVAVDAPAHREI